MYFMVNPDIHYLVSILKDARIDWDTQLGTNMKIEHHYATSHAWMGVVRLKFRRDGGK